MRCDGSKVDTTGARAGRASRRRDVSMLRTERVHVIQPVAFLLPAEHVHGGADEGRGLAVALSRHVARDAELGPAEAVVSSCRRPPIWDESVRAVQSCHKEQQAALVA